MRVTALGAYRMKGTSKKSGAVYDMAKLVIRVPIETMATATMQRMGYGYTVNELDMEVEAVAQFNFSFPPEGIEMDLVVGSALQYGRLTSIITGCTLVKPLKAVA
jgi:hypothetical protein